MGCTNSHPWSQPVPGRIHVDFEPRRCCCCSKGLPIKDEARTVPPALKEKGLSQDDWNEFVLERLPRITAALPSCCWDCTLSFMTCCVFDCTCKNKLEHRFLGSLVTWRDEFNEVLAKHGVYMTFKSHAWMEHTGQNSQDRRVAVAMIFALDEAQAAQLKIEQANTGETHSCCCKCCICGRDQAHEAIMLA